MDSILIRNVIVKSRIKIPELKKKKKPRDVIVIRFAYPVA